MHKRKAISQKYDFGSFTIEGVEGKCYANAEIRLTDDGCFSACASLYNSQVSYAGQCLDTLYEIPYLQQNAFFREILTSLLAN